MHVPARVIAAMLVDAIGVTIAETTELSEEEDGCVSFSDPDLKDIHVQVGYDYADVCIERVVDGEYKFLMGKARRDLDDLIKDLEWAKAAAKAIESGDDIPEQPP